MACVQSMPLRDAAEFRCCHTIQTAIKATEFRVPESLQGQDDVCMNVTCVTCQKVQDWILRGC